MASKYNINLLNQKFGYFTVTHQLDGYTYEHGCKRYQKWECVCDCGTHFISNSYNIQKGLTSCGEDHNKKTIIIGKNFKKLTVLGRYIGQKQKNQRVKWWFCLCSCGRIIIVKTSDLTSGKLNSCEWCAKIKYTDRTIPAKKALYLHYRRDAIKRGITFELFFEEFIKITSLNCTYCGEPPSGIYNTNIEKEDRTLGTYTYNGIDRLDNFIGYTTANSVPCCKICNQSKADRKLIDFITWAFKLNKHINK